MQAFSGETSLMQIGTVSWGDRRPIIKHRRCEAGQENVGLWFPDSDSLCVKESEVSSHQEDTDKSNHSFNFLATM